MPKSKLAKLKVKLLKLGICGCGIYFFQAINYQMNQPFLEINLLYISIEFEIVQKEDSLVKQLSLSQKLLVEKS